MDFENNHFCIAKNVKVRTYKQINFMGKFHIIEIQNKTAFITYKFRCRELPCQKANLVHRELVRTAISLIKTWQ